MEQPKYRLEVYLVRPTTGEKIPISPATVLPQRLTGIFTSSWDVMQASREAQALLGPDNGIHLGGWQVEVEVGDVAKASPEVSAAARLMGSRVTPVKTASSRETVKVAQAARRKGRKPRQWVEIDGPRHPPVVEGVFGWTIVTPYINRTFIMPGGKCWKVVAHLGTAGAYVAVKCVPADPASGRTVRENYSRVFLRECNCGYWASTVQVGKD